jgi:hypothetical protein
MPLNTGTMNLADLQAVTNQTVRDFGFEPFADALTNDLERVQRDRRRGVPRLLRDHGRPAPPRRRSQAGDMIEADDFSRAPTQKPGVGGTLGFPMHLHQTAIGWTQRFLNRATVGELATVQLNIQGAHRRALLRRFKQRDLRAEQPDLLGLHAAQRDRHPGEAVLQRRLVVDPERAERRGVRRQHAHALHGRGVAECRRAARSRQQRRTSTSEGRRCSSTSTPRTRRRCSALSGFIPYVDNRLCSTRSAWRTRRSPRRTPATPGNRADRPLRGRGGVGEAVGHRELRGDAGRGRAEKPLALRTENGQAPALVRVAENDAFPLIAQFYESLFGFGALNRGAGAVHYFGGGSYVEPTIS